MKEFLKTLKPALCSLLWLTILLGILYPGFIWICGQVFFHQKANGSLFYHQDGEVLGSVLIAQNFSRAEYFHPRPSAAGYDAANSSGSNLSQTSQKLIDLLKERAAHYRSENGLSPQDPIPVDAIAASGSGLDPHISVENAVMQAARVAKARGLSEDVVVALIKKHTEGPTWKIWGTKHVNVLFLNLALDKSA